MVLTNLPFLLIICLSHCNFLLFTVVSRRTCLPIYLPIRCRTCLWYMRRSEPATTSACSLSQRLFDELHHLCVDRFTSMDEDWCYQCSQQTHSGFHKYVLSFRMGFSFASNNIANGQYQRTFPKRHKMNENTTFNISLPSLPFKRLKSRRMYE